LQLGEAGLVGFWNDTLKIKTKNIVSCGKTEKDQKIPIRSHTTPSGRSRTRNHFHKKQNILFSLSLSACDRLSSPRIAIPSPLSDSLLRRASPPSAAARSPRGISLGFSDRPSLLLPRRRFWIAVTLCSVHEPPWLPGVDAERTRLRPMATWVWAILYSLRSRASPLGLRRSHSLPSSTFFSSNIIMIMRFCFAMHISSLCFTVGSAWLSCPFFPVSLWYCWDEGGILHCLMSYD